jgi:hypothetical protein
MSQIGDFMVVFLPAAALVRLVLGLMPEETLAHHRRESQAGFPRSVLRGDAARPAATAMFSAHSVLQNMPSGRAVLSLALSRDG